jgi:hypothetical protein
MRKTYGSLRKSFDAMIRAKDAPATALFLQNNFCGTSATAARCLRQVPNS